MRARRGIGPRPPGALSLFVPSGAARGRSSLDCEAGEQLTMSHELICAWMGLPAGEWPPDHYRLLGLEPGESNRELIEHRVHERMDAVRRYQMTHPEQATEAMNRLAQAFVCLTEPHAKQRYDEALFGRSLALAELPSESRRPRPPGSPPLRASTAAPRRRCPLSVPRRRRCPRTPVRATPPWPPTPPSSFRRSHRPTLERSHRSSPPRSRSWHPRRRCRRPRARRAPRHRWR
jgi:hypothetical protein